MLDFESSDLAAEKVPELLFSGVIDPRDFQPDDTHNGRPMIKLNQGRKKKLLKAATDRIAELASTYIVTLDFRDEVLQQTPRGQQMTRTYYDNLDQIWEAAKDNVGVIKESRENWLRTRPFVEEILNAARGRPGTATRFTQADYAQLRALAKRYREAKSSNQRFKDTVEELEAELAGYVGLDGNQAFEKLKNTPPKSTGAVASR
jgi:hypothetical protein